MSLLAGDITLGSCQPQQNWLYDHVSNLATKLCIVLSLRIKFLFRRIFKKRKKKKAMKYRYLKILPNIWEIIG